jgi:protoporphyrinogen oxidase
MSRKAIIIGAGPAGLTAAYELLKRTDIIPIILEKSNDIGGISKTVNYKGNRIDIGGHRFFSKSDRVMEWWMNIMPLENSAEKDSTITYQNKSRKVSASAGNAEDPDKVMLVRKRISRIYFLRKFFAYPIQLSFDTLKKLGLLRTVAIIFSYLWARLFPRKPETSLEDFFINRFGKQLYLLFFKDYTEKVWGVSCKKISAEWGAQRIKGISIGKALAHAAKSLKQKATSNGDIQQKGVETSLIERFLYPKYGPGQLWEEVARQVQEMGGQIIMNSEVSKIHVEEGKVVALDAFDKQADNVIRLEGDYFFSTMPVKELIAGMDADIPAKVKEVAAGLQYRDFITVGILLKKMAKEDLQDTWIYIQERDVKVGRLQLFNNWSPYMVKEPGNTWIGMEYFCNDWDAFWNQSDEAIKKQAIGELEKMGLAQVNDVLDATVLRMEKTYPAYFGTYSEFNVVRDYLDEFENLFLVGRNGMHKYNNSDHSMLTAMVAVDNICVEVTKKENIWSINTEQEYHEEKANTDISGKVEKRFPQRTVPQIHPSLVTFKDFLLNITLNRNLLLLSSIAIVLQLILFKMLYPFAGFINGDSYVYLETAFFNLDINTYPVGYSNFLRLISVFTHSDVALVSLQYFMLQCASLYFAYTIFYFFHPGKLVKIATISFITFNPVFLYLANYVSSDSIFIAGSIFWLALLIWIMERPKWTFTFIQLLTLYFLLTVRYNALYYPILTTIAVCLSRKRFVYKFSIIIATLLITSGFIWHTRNCYLEETGVRQFTPFSGWQMANNALYTYRYIKKEDRKPVPKQWFELDRTVRAYFDSSRNVLSHPQELLHANTWYMWDPRSPLQIYSSRINPKSSSLKRWASVGPLYAGYGRYLVEQYPTLYLKYYLLPNIAKYYAPPVEFLESYNMGRDSVQQIAIRWFHYKSKKVGNALNSYNVNILHFYPVMAGVINAVFLVSMLFFIVLRGFRQNRPLWRISLFSLLFWSINFTFSVLSAPIALRFQLFPILIFITVIGLLLEFICNVAFNSKHSNISAQSPTDKIHTQRNLA